MFYIYLNDRHRKKKVKNASQDAEAKIKTEEDHAEGKPSSETPNKVIVKMRDAL
jgi:hypothetical protein